MRSRRRSSGLEWLRNSCLEGGIGITTTSMVRAAQPIGTGHFRQIRSIPPQPKQHYSNSTPFPRTVRRFSITPTTPDRLQPALATQQHCRSIIKASSNLGIIEINREDRLFPATPSATLILTEKEVTPNRQATPEQTQQLKSQRKTVQEFTTALTGSVLPWTSENISDVTRLKIMEKIEELVKESGLGNCDEHSALAWLDLNRQGARSA